MSVDSSECRICFENEAFDDPFISPCLCKGTSKYVHLSCLMTWRNFNRDGAAFKKCMECNKEYVIKTNYEAEKINMYLIPNMHAAYVFFNIFTFALSIFIWIADNMLHDNPFPANKHLNSSSLLFLIHHDQIVPFIWYYSYAMFIETMAFNIFFGIHSFIKIKRRSLYFNNIKIPYILTMMWALQNMLWYILFIENGEVLINILGVLSITQPFISYQLIKNHEIIITSMNSEIEETILSYEDNPLMYLENIIIEP